MRIFQGKEINLLYIDIINTIMYEGKDITKDGRKIKELFPCFIKLENPKEGLMLIKGRPYNPAFIVAETLWNLTGDTEMWLCNYNKLYHKYFTNSKLEAGYGNRILNWDKDTNQFELVAKRLLEEPNTQHADITIFNPSFDLKNPKFVPCITKLKFRIRENKLDMTSFMRSQDMWLGFPYDINLLLTIFQLMSIRINVEMGDYNHYCDVVRIYENDFLKVKKIEKINSDYSNRIELNNICDFNILIKYRDLIKYLPENTLELIEDEPEYWRNGIKACLAYSYIHKANYDDASEIIKSITNCLKEQFGIWGQHYHKGLF